MAKRRTRTIVLCLIILVGLVLVWRGIWEISQRFFGPETSLLIGVALLAIVGIISREFLLEHI